MLNLSRPTTSAPKTRATTRNPSVTRRFIGGVSVEKTGKKLAPRPPHCRASRENGQRQQDDTRQRDQVLLPANQCDVTWGGVGRAHVDEIVLFGDPVRAIEEKGLVA